MQTPSDPKELAALVEQLRHACSVALGDLLAQGMPPGVSTGRLLLAAIGAANEYLVQTGTSATDPASREHAPRLTFDRTRITRIVGCACACGWRSPPGTTDFDDAYAMHYALHAAAGEEVITS